MSMFEQLSDYGSEDEQQAPAPSFSGY